MESVVNFLEDMALSFIPLFVAMDPLGNLPIVIALTQDETPAERSRTLRLALITAFALGLLFIGLGTFIFSVLGITADDFLVAGGIILLVLSIKHITTGHIVDLPPGERIWGVVPIGTPLITGPATLTAALLLVEEYGFAAVIVAFILNLLVAGALFSQANRVAKLLGTSGLQAAGKIISLLLAAIAINLIRRGLIGLGIL